MSRVFLEAGENCRPCHSTLCASSVRISTSIGWFREVISRHMSEHASRSLRVRKPAGPCSRSARPILRHPSSNPGEHAPGYDYITFTVLNSHQFVSISRVTKAPTAAEARPDRLLPKSPARRPQSPRRRSPPFPKHSLLTLLFKPAAQFHRLRIQAQHQPKKLHLSQMSLLASVATHLQATLTLMVPRRRKSSLRSQRTYT